MWFVCLKIPLKRLLKAFTENEVVVDAETGRRHTRLLRLLDDVDCLVSVLCRGDHSLSVGIKVERLTIEQVNVLNLSGHSLVERGKAGSTIGVSLLLLAFVVLSVLALLSNGGQLLVHVGESFRDCRRKMVDDLNLPGWRESADDPHALQSTAALALALSIQLIE